MNWGWAEDAWLPKWVVLQAPVELKKTCSTRATHRLPSSTGTFDCYVPYRGLRCHQRSQGLVSGLPLAFAASIVSYGLSFLEYSCIFVFLSLRK